MAKKKARKQKIVTLSDQGQADMLRAGDGLFWELSPNGIKPYSRPMIGAGLTVLWKVWEEISVKEKGAKVPAPRRARGKKTSRNRHRNTVR